MSKEFKYLQNKHRTSEEVIEVLRVDNNRDKNKLDEIEIPVIST